MEDRARELRLVDVISRWLETLSMIVKRVKSSLWWRFPNTYDFIAY
ncbi:MAG: hypothetical protein ACTSXX_01625 [Candidatus Baldrarchaeia archaeon]